MKYCILLFYISYTKNIYIYIYIYGPSKNKFLTPPLEVACQILVSHSSIRCRGRLMTTQVPHTRVMHESIYVIQRPFSSMYIIITFYSRKNLLLDTFLICIDFIQRPYQHRFCHEQNSVFAANYCLLKQTSPNVRMNILC